MRYTGSPAQTAGTRLAEVPLADQETKIPLKIRLGALIMAGYMRLVWWTARKRFADPEHIRQFFDAGQPVIVAAWHRHTLQTPIAYLAQRPKGRRLWAIASASKDGALAALGLGWLGIDSVRGSTSKGGAKALLRMAKIIKAGEDLAFTPDGPRGPLYSVADGVLLAARISGAPIVGLSFAASHFKLLGSWDRMVVPLPFSRVCYGYGRPLYVPRDAEGEALDALRDQLQAELKRLEQRAMELL